MSQAPVSLSNVSWLQKALRKKAKKNGDITQIHYVGRGEKIPGDLNKKLSADCKARLRDKSPIENFLHKGTTHWLLQASTHSMGHHYELFSPSPYAMARDLAGTCYRQLTQSLPANLEVHYHGESVEELMGLCVGLEMAQYNFKNHWPKPQNGVQTPGLKIFTSFSKEKEILKEAALLGEGVNVARFLVDLPPNILTPKSYVELLKNHFSQAAKTQVQVWDHKRLSKENMGLHIAVGQGSVDKSYMVHIHYRGGEAQRQPVAFVGKGITFDSGGLDVKPANNMRLMKKDMGGSATIAGLAHRVIMGKLPLNCDFYFALAENAINEQAFRPGDVLTARNGKTVEIHNTDAEGRLVLGDVLTVAAENKPEFLIDVATLTGAIKYGLGAQVPGLFSNHDNLADSLLRAGQIRGDVSWRMPLIPEERRKLKSDVADMVNSVDGFGGAVTAALFLENFTGRVPWAHFDIYSWIDRPNGLYGASGGSGQLVQALSHFVSGQI